MFLAFLTGGILESLSFDQSFLRNVNKIWNFDVFDSFQIRFKSRKIILVQQRNVEVSAHLSTLLGTALSQERYSEWYLYWYSETYLN